jgi:hypothetical protein
LGPAEAQLERSSLESAQESALFNKINKMKQKSTMIRKGSKKRANTKEKGRNGEDREKESEQSEGK